MWMVDSGSRFSPPSWIVPFPITGFLSGTLGQTCARIPKRSGILDPRSWMILDLIFSFSLVILEILDPVTAAFPWDPTDPGSRTEKIFFGSWGSWIQLEQVMVGFCRSWILHNNMSLHLEYPVHPTKNLLLFPHIYALLKLEHS